ncbi:hypothetical protein P8452_66223 [Trifolium repens]|nr:hypothetical protein P8452_66223 [Trifolium repens]
MQETFVFPRFYKFLESHDVGTGQDSDEETNGGYNWPNSTSKCLLKRDSDDDNAGTRVGKTLTGASVDSLCKLVKEQHSLPALTCLINAYRAACHSDSEITSITDSEILAFTICRLRASIIFLSAFPSLVHKLLKICVDLWATGDRSLSSHSFLMIRDIASVCTSNWLDICFVKTYKAFIGRSPSEHTHFLRNSFVELCCLDVQKSSNKATICIRRLGEILLKGWQTKKKEVVDRICSWQYINCIDLWVSFI